MRLLIRGVNQKNSMALAQVEVDPVEVKTFEDLLAWLKLHRSLENKNFGFNCRGENIQLDRNISEYESSRVFQIRELRLGGKGGFGSLLKGQPPTKKRTTNFDACRDLSGRRLRHLNQERRLKEWEEKKREEERLIKVYNKSNEDVDVKNMMESETKKEISEKNKKFIIEANNISNSVAESIRYLQKKKKRGKESEHDLKKETKKVTFELSDSESCRTAEDKDQVEKEIFSL